MDIICFNEILFIFGNTIFFTIVQLNLHLSFNVWLYL